MFERFTKDAREVVIAAQAEARTIGHRQIGTEHLLMALLTEHDGTGSRALHEHGADADTLRDLVRRLSPAPAGEPELAGAHAGGGDRSRRRGLLARLIGTGGGHIPFSKRAKQSLEQSLKAALDAKSKEITSGHLLLGVLGVPESTAFRILTEAGIDPAALRTTTSGLTGGAGDENQ